MTAISPYLTYVTALAIAAVIPGPGVAALIGQALGRGLRAALMFLIGITLGDVAYLTIAVLGLSALTTLFAGALVLIKLAGGAYLLYLGTVFWRSKAGLTQVQSAKPASDAKTLTAGFALTLGNPKTIVFYLALLPAVMDLDQVSAGQWAGMAVLTILVLLVTLAPYAILANRARKALTDPRALHRLNRAAALVIGGAGAVILVQAMQAVIG
jgi:threonine/homoserine/homoserine lactone efflux protein